AVEEAGPGKLPDLGDLGGVDGERHGQPPSGRRARPACDGLSFNRKRGHRQPPSPLFRPRSPEPSPAERKTVAVLLPLAVDGPYSYAGPAGMDLAPGDIVVAPLGTRDYLGVVWDDPVDESIGHNRLKAVAEKYGAPPLTAEMRGFVDWVARYTLAARG